MPELQFGAASTGTQVLEWISKVTSAAQWVVKFIPGDLDDKLVDIFRKVDTMPGYSAKQFIQELVDTVVGAFMKNTPDKKPAPTPIPEPDGPPLFGASEAADPIAVAYVNEKFRAAGGLGALPKDLIQFAVSLPPEVASYAAASAAFASKDIGFAKAG